ncbi:dATP/dGTP pyrophosphohydrolase domain-containing protein [Prosthecobacter sp.]|uniref:dATP/dGTP pyrophosphohydrolase domain-containing protein n=1 Tax=Prosthecobacter sp. TaxID=1965333 RepID=UPI003783D5F2
MNTPYDLIAHLERQVKFSEKTFGPGCRTFGILDHIRKELAEIDADPMDLEEWVDVILLAFDGAWRIGAKPWEIAQAIEAKLTKNENRTWPDWRTAPAGKAIEHTRSADESQSRLQPGAPSNE